MILTGPEIRRQVGMGRIVIDPFVTGHVNPNSYNYRLAPMLREVHLCGTRSVGQRPSATPIMKIPTTGVTLQPGRLYLGSTLETLGSSHYVTSLIGRSSMGRLGLFLQVSANLGHQGAVHRWTLELHCCRPLRLYPQMIIGQVTFWMARGAIFPHTGYYARFDAPTPAKDVS